MKNTDFPPVCASLPSPELSEAFQPPRPSPSLLRSPPWWPRPPGKLRRRRRRAATTHTRPHTQTRRRTPTRPLTLLPSPRRQRPPRPRPPPSSPGEMRSQRSRSESGFIVSVEFSFNVAAFFIFHFIHLGCHTAHAVRCKEHALQPYC